MQCVFVVCLLFTFQAPGSRESLPFVFCISDVDGKLPLCIDTAVVVFFLDVLISCCVESFCVLLTVVLGASSCGVEWLLSSSVPASMVADEY